MRVAGKSRRVDPLAQPAANPARVYDYLLGGNTNLDADRQAAKLLIRAKPDLLPNVQANRRFLGRAVKHLAGAEGIWQFLDIGTGIPTMDNTHEVAQRASPAARVVYVDNDPAVLAHAHALLTSTPEGTTAFVQADLRGPQQILAQAAGTLDFAEPVAVMMLGILYLIEDTEDPYGIVTQIMAATAPGSWLVISHPASDVHGEAAARGARRYAKATGLSQTNRTHAGVTRFFDGLELAEPGVIQANRWRPDPGDDTGVTLSNWCGAARKP